MRNIVSSRRLLHENKEITENKIDEHGHKYILFRLEIIGVKMPVYVSLTLRTITSGHMLPLAQTNLQVWSWQTFKEYKNNLQIGIFGLVKKVINKVHHARVQ